LIKIAFYHSSAFPITERYSQVRVACGEWDIWYAVKKGIDLAGEIGSDEGTLEYQD
jgi:hypothetical protein